MTRTKFACAALAVPFLLAACVTDRTEESSESLATMEASTQEMAEEMGAELDPNDPDVLVCPATGQMVRKSASGGEGGHHSGDESGMDF